ncbi:HAD-IIIC family phosphatase [Kitasatospora sp. NPDC051705]|uniref:HAD-IIIC family phosphatase n=1 Tax=Kitasatospora sp. NPDC051705 TaxID=3364057 RepID=UPI0037A20DEB
MSAPRGATAPGGGAGPERPTVKVLVWDLDDTLWDGTVLEGDDPAPFPAATAALRELDGRGVLHAVASRSDRAAATAHLERLGLHELFTVLEVGWGPKSGAVRRIAEAIGIGLDTVAFVDNDPVERAEVAAAHPEVRCYPAEQVGALAGLPEFRPPFVTADARERRLRYRAEARRAQAGGEYQGTPQEFLASLDLTLTVRRAEPGDLARAHELTVRTHQLNTTGRTYDLARLRALCGSPDHRVLVAELTDRFGDYGTIGLALSERIRYAAGEGPAEPAELLRLLLLSCRVMSRGVGPALIGHVVRSALAEGRRPLAEFVPTEVNRVMLVNLRFAGFTVLGPAEEGRLLLGYPPAAPPPPPPGHLRLITPPPAETPPPADTRGPAESLRPAPAGPGPAARPEPPATP